jgi:iron complex transport system substrate-binding protein
MKHLLLSAIFLLSAFVSFSKEIKIVSLSPAVTEMIYAVGAESRLVGRSRVCDFPAKVKALPIAGDLGTPDIEMISKLRADVVISDISNPSADWNRLRKMGMKVVLLKADSIAQYRDNILKIGKITGRDLAAEREWNRFSEKINQLKKAGKTRSRIATVVLLGVNPLVSCSNSTFIGEILDIAGADNITGKVERRYFILSAEFVLEKNPEIAVLAGMTGHFRKTLLDTAVLRSAKFVRNNAIIDNVPSEFFCRLSPRTPTAIELLTKELDKYRKN